MLPLSSIHALGLFFAFGCAVLVPAGAHAVVVDLVAQKDNTIYSEADDSSNGGGDYFFAGLNGDGRQRRGLIAFDVAGLDITTSSVKLIELSQSGKRFRVEAYSAEPTPPSSINEKAIVDAKAVGEAIRRAVKRAGAKATDVAIAISGDAAITKVIQMPSSLSERDLEGRLLLRMVVKGKLNVILIIKAYLLVTKGRTE